MTKLTGIPTIPGASTRVRVTGPFYQRGDAADPGHHSGSWENATFKDDAGNIIDLIMPRKDQGDPMISGDVKIYLSYIFASGRDFTQTLTYRSTYWVETAPGFFDLSKNPDPDVPQIATAEQLQRLSTLLVEGNALNAESTRLQADIAQKRDDLTQQVQEAVATIGIVSSTFTGLVMQGPLTASDGTTYYDIQQQPAATQAVTVGVNDYGDLYYLPGAIQ